MLKHGSYQAHLIALQKLFVEEITVKLDRDLADVFVLQFVVKPAVLQVGPDQHKFKIFNFFNMVADHPAGACRIDNQVQFIFFMIVQGKVKMGLVAGENRETVALCKRRNFPDNVLIHGNMIA